MDVLKTVLLIVQVVSSLAIIVLVLLQHGKGADMGAAFGSGSSGSLFGASGSANFLSRATAVLITLFFITTVGLAFFAQAPATKKTPAGVVSKLPDLVTPSASAPVLPNNEVPK